MQNTQAIHESNAFLYGIMLTIKCFLCVRRVLLNTNVFHKKHNRCFYHGIVLVLLPEHWVGRVSCISVLLQLLMTCARNSWTTEPSILQHNLSPMECLWISRAYLRNYDWPRLRTHRSTNVDLCTHTHTHTHIQRANKHNLGQNIIRNWFNRKKYILASSMLMALL